MDKLLDIISKWEPFGQGLFFLLLAGMVIGGVCALARYFVALFRGWPPSGTPMPEDEE
jgi:hypothetical protein